MLEAFVFQNLFQTTAKGQVEIQLQGEVMETSDPVKHKNNDTVGFFFQWKMEYFTTCLLTILKLVSLKLGVIE